MSKSPISRKAIQRNVTWIESVEQAVAELNDDSTIREIMKAAGRKCARQILDDCTEILGRRPANVDELIDTTNKRRLDQLNLDNSWERDGNSAHLKINECACTLVRAGLAKPNPIHCLCTVGMFEELFSAVCQGPVVVKVLKTIGFGDASCEFTVDFQE